jgi:hypothetical protein
MEFVCFFVFVCVMGRGGGLYVADSLFACGSLLQHKFFAFIGIWLFPFSEIHFYSL